MHKNLEIFEVFAAPVGGKEHGFKEASYNTSPCAPPFPTLRESSPVVIAQRTVS